MTIELSSDAREAKIFPRGFTLIEIIVALTIITVVAAVAIPTLKGLDRDEKARQPLKTLAETVQEVRTRAMHERQTYQIVFERDGIHATPVMFPYERRDEFLKQLDELRTPPKVEPIGRVVTERAAVERTEIGSRNPQEPAAGAAKEAAHYEMPWTKTIPLSLGTECEVLMWGDGEWDLIEGEKMRRWVFQPSGMANPARVRLRTGSADLEAGFDLLTGEMIAERTRLKSIAP